MKIPGKSPLKTITKKLPSLDTQQTKDLKTIISATSSKNIVSLNTKEILYKKSKKSFSVNILNYVEPYLIKGQRYTLFYTEFDHNLKEGDRVFITGGFYDSDLLIQHNKYDKKADGYMVYYVDRTQVVLDIEYTGDLPYEEYDIDNYIKVYVVNTQEEFDYLIQARSTRGFDYLTSRFQQYGPLSNNNFLYINGTFALRNGANTYNILGFDDGLGNYSLSYSDAFLILSGTTSGYLTDITVDVLAGDHLDYTAKKTNIISSVFITTPLVSIKKISINTSVDHGYTSSVYLKLEKLNGTGSYTFLEGQTLLFQVQDQNTVYTFYPSFLLPSLTISSGYITNPKVLLFNNNGNLKIINSDFECSGIKFKKGYPYYFDTNWEVNRLHLQPIITEQNFRNGVFKKGEFNQGLLGTHQETVIYDGSQVNFTLGSIINTLWQDGNIGKGDGNTLSYFTSFTEFGLPEIKVNESNNRGLGYNLVYDSTIQRSIIESGLFYNTNFGINLNNIHTMTEYYTGITTTFSVVTKFGEYLNCEFNFSNIKRSTLLTADVNNSKIENSKSVNSEIERSVFLNSKYNSDKIIKIKNYDERFVKLYDASSTTIRDYKLYKFYIDVSSFSRISEFQNFYFDGLEIQNSDLLNFFDEKFSFNEYRHVYVKKSSVTHTRTSGNTLVYLSSKDENIKTISNFGIDGSNALTNNDKDVLPSIDIYFRLPSSVTSKKDEFTNFGVRQVEVLVGPYFFDINPFTSMTSWGITPSIVELFTSVSSFTFSGVTSSESLYNELQLLSVGTWTYSGDIFQVEGDFTYRNLIYYDTTDGLSAESIGLQTQTEDQTREFKSAVNIDNAYILDSDFKSGLFKDSIWVSGNYMNYSLEHTFATNNQVKYDFEIENGGPFDKLLKIYSLHAGRTTLIDTDDIMYLNGIYFDSTVISGQNLVKLPNVYKVNQVTTGASTRNYRIYDIINGTHSSLYNLLDTTSLSGSDLFFLTPGAENFYNYVYPVKFENSKIKSGIFRKSYFENCLINNPTFNNSERSPKNFRNWRSLLITDTFFQDNSNTVRSGLFYNSFWLSGNDNWINGIFYNSTWNVHTFTYSLSTIGGEVSPTLNKFNDGIVKESKWIDGIFGNGQFYKNNSNQVFTASVYSDLVRSNTSSRRLSAAHRTRYSWVNGTFESGTFEQSTFESGKFLTGDFFNSTFLTGEAYGGNFGKRNLKYQSTRVASGSFSNVNVISSEFRAANPDGSISDTFEINWYNGIFNNGLFGVLVNSASYSESGINYSFRSNWYDGIWQNGQFTDTARWMNGKFNNGKFTSYFGYPFVTAASYSLATKELFAWENGEFNSGEFGLGVTGSNSTWWNGQFNGGIFTGRYWNDGIFTRGKFIGSGSGSTKLSNIPNYVSQFSDDFWGLWNSGIVSEIKDKHIKDKKIVQIPEREFTRKKTEYIAEIRNALWRGGTFSHNSGLFKNSVWTDGNFDKGNFVDSSFNPYVNYLVNGQFDQQNDDTGNFAPSNLNYWSVNYSDTTESGGVVGSYFISSTNQYPNDPKKYLTVRPRTSIATLYQTSGLIIGENYTFRMIVLNSQDIEVRFGDWTKTLLNRNFTLGNDTWFIGATSQSLGSQPTVDIFTASTNFYNEPPDPGSIGYLNYIDSTADGSLYVIYPGILENGRQYYVRFYTFDKTNMDVPYIGSCDSTQVTFDNFVLTTPFTDGINITFSTVGVASAVGAECLYEAVITAQFTDLMINFTTLTANSEVSITGLIVTGNTGLFASNISQRTSYSYQFTAEGSDFTVELIPQAEAGTSGPEYISGTISILSMELVKGESGFNVSDTCYWENGTFVNSEFFVSKWYNGKWKSGNATGMIWKNGVADYMNAYNVYWEGGRWRNGNWDGAPFGYENLTENGCLLSFTLSSINGSEVPNLQELVSGADWNGKNMFNDSGPGTGEPLLASGEAQISITINSPITSGSFQVSVSDGSSGIQDFTTDWRDPSLDPETSNSFVNAYGFPFVRHNPLTHLNTGNTYRVTVNIGGLTVARAEDKDDVGIQISIGRPGSVGAYGETSGTYDGSIYPTFKDVVSTEDFVSPFRKITELDGHTGQVIPDVVVSGLDGWVGSGGQIVETLVARDNRTLYLHFNLYGVQSLSVDSIIVERVNCLPAAEINEGFTSDVLTNVAKYRQSIGDPSYQEMFINSAFTYSIDGSFLPIPGSPNVNELSMTQSANVVEFLQFVSTTTSIQHLPFLQANFALTSRSVNTVIIGGSKGGCVFVGKTGYLVSPDPNLGIFGGVSYLDSVNIGEYWFSSTDNGTFYVIDQLGGLDVFPDLAEYEITIKYSFMFETFDTVSSSGIADFNDPNTPTSAELLGIDCGFKLWVGYYEINGQIIDNGGYEEIITDTIQLKPLYVVDTKYNANTCVNICTGTCEYYPYDLYRLTDTGYYSNDCQIRTWTGVFNPSFITTTSDNTKRLRFRKKQGRYRVQIHGVNIQKKSNQYDKRYTNATYSVFQADPSYDDTLNLPVYEKLSVADNGLVISTRYGNGMFVSGTASAFSSIWENGVWNEGLRYDKNVYVFEDLAKLSGSGKVDVRKASFDIRSTKLGTVPNFNDGNYSRVNYSSTNWLLTLNAIEGFVVFENHTIDQVNYDPSYYFKRGDKVSVGNIVSIDINDKRKLIKDPFTVVNLFRGTDRFTGLSYWQIVLSVIINFPIRTIERDSENHPIYVSKNIWLNGAYLNGTFRGIWTNGLFKGRPYLTKMVDSQWIEGRFDGGHFKGLTASIIDNIDSAEPIIEIIHSGLVQNFVFKDNNVSGLPLGFIYNSWLELNHINTRAVNLGKKGLISNVAGKIDEANYNNKAPRANTWGINNYYGYPTKDILSSVSYFRNGDDLDISAYSLGWKFQRYEQFIPSDGEFLEPFDNYEETRSVVQVVGGGFVGIQYQGISEYPGMSSFLNQGWTYSYRLNMMKLNSNVADDGRTLFRFSSNTEMEYPLYQDARWIESGFYGEKDVAGYNHRKMVVQPNNPIDVFGDSGYATSIEDVVGSIRLDNIYTKLPKERYTILEFKLEHKGATFNNIKTRYPLSLYPFGTQSSGPRTYNILDPFNYLGATFGRDSYTLENGTVISYDLLPEYSNPYTWPINHLLTSEEVKVEYFYNKPDISFYFYEDIDSIGDNNKRYYFDYIRYTEVDMVPFFRYATESRIAQYIQAPFSTVAPYIDYSNPEFSLIDNINVSEASFAIVDTVINIFGGGGQVLYDTEGVVLDFNSDKQDMIANQPELNGLGVNNVLGSFGGGVEYDPDTDPITNTSAGNNDRGDTGTNTTNNNTGTNTGRGNPFNQSSPGGN